MGALPAHDYLLLAGRMEPVELKYRQVLSTTNAPVEDVHFPESGIASVIANTTDGRGGEVYLYGRDGMSAPSLLLGVDYSPHEQVMQCEGISLRIAATDLRRAARDIPALRRILLSYVHVMALQGAYTALSNGSFNIQERLARWLLMCADRSEDGVNLTHEFLSVMLSVRRSSVTVALQTLETAGLIQARRGHVTVLDRVGLELTAGGSYGRPEAEYEKLIGPLT